MTEELNSLRIVTFNLDSYCGNLFLRVYPPSPPQGHLFVFLRFDLIKFYTISNMPIGMVNIQQYYLWTYNAWEPLLRVT